ncbi:hypothetical protein L195_g027084 [Trifolium pratense]|uniref:Uncharacterized protein n=1 Tax=Trifolium pratense TaxID=57577 RepID=A0A2K3KY50_TRIPR|nr:hypothetical protein L195_g027084 [Trifolium pratense]
MCNCPFKIRATPSTDGSGWKVQVICGVHNHGLPNQYAGHPPKAHLNADENKRVEDLTKRHVAPRHDALSNLQHVCFHMRLNAPYEDDLHIGEVVCGCELHR